MAKLFRLVAKFRGDNVTLVAYKRAARGRSSRAGEVSCARDQLVATMEKPEVISKLLLREKSA